jgi:hypothetical protein
MNNRVFAWLFGKAVVVLLLSLAPSAATGQTARPWDPPRTADGKPDLEGVWEPELGGSYSIEDTGLQGIQQIGRAAVRRGPSRVVDPPDGKIPYQPWARARQQHIYDNHLNPKLEHLDPVSRCFLGGAVREFYRLTAYQIVQTPGYIVVQYENGHAYRVITMDGRPHISDKIQLWMGDSRGRWEGNTLVVDNTNFNGKAWFDIVGNFQTDDLHVVERFTRVAPDKIAYEATIEDPKIYATPWKVALSIVRVKEPRYELMEEACVEGNRDPEHLLRR